MALTRLVSDYKDSVRVATTGANINLAAAPNTLDGYSLALNDRVLVKDQSPSYLNGIYRVTTLGTGSNGSWTRSSDFNDWREISAGNMVFVELGSTNGNAFYFINGAEPNVTVNTTAINFTNLYSVNSNVTSFPGNVNIAGTLNVVGNIISSSYETITLTEYANALSVTGNITLSNSANINVGAGGNIYLGSTAVGRYYGGNTAPTAPNLGDHWYQGNTDVLYAYIQDANNNKYWLDLTSNPSSYGNLTVANTLTLNGNTNNYGTANLGSLSQVIITGGTAGYVLSTTNGAGALNWVPVSATAGGSNTMVQFSDAGAIGGATYLQYNKTSGNLVSNSTTAATSTTTGALVVSGGAAFGGAIYANNFNGIAVYAGTIGNTSANLVGTLQTASQTNITSVGTLTSLTTSGTISAPTINAGTIGNSGANITGSTVVTTGNIYGGGNIIAASGTASTSKTTGAIVTSGTGGIGVGGSVFANAVYSDYHIYANGNPLKAGSTFTTSNTAPAGAIVGDWWYRGNTDALYNYVQDAASNKFWLDVTDNPSNFANLTASSATITNATITNLTQTILPSSNASINIGSASSGYFNAIYGVTFVGTSTTAKYADLAEMYHGDDHYMPGTVVIFGGDFDVTISTQSHDSRVAGIISTNPAYLMNDNFELDTWVPVALTGRVPCRVKGPIDKGDLLVSSDIPGVAQRLDKNLYNVGCIIGKSIDIINDDSIKKIEVAVGRF